ncbi:ABC transporter substrate-binding protein [Acidisphaera sp. L21]|uniref:ABC transporter substrate-binding protein n=1 Tax=Acidisphaera sp. L21 TaxID=1641851 RepID=UPI0020B133EF|nr:ABC transporter substrate-binding protein [Acidisphaera sp. L21]
MAMASRLAASCLAVAIGLSALPASAVTFKWANDGDANSMDPYTRSETFLLTFTQNFYDPLVRRDKNLKVEAALAESWEQPNPTTWRFHLRHGVKFHDGTDFTADDVVFSYQRVIAPGSQLNGYMQAVTSVKKIDDFTVDFLTKVPDPIFLEEITGWAIMSKKWSETNHAEQAMDLTKKEENFATRHENGTGPYVLDTREPDRRTTMHAFPGWWDKMTGNADKIEFNVISNAATRVAALLSGDIDMMYTVPPQDVQRLQSSADLKVLETPELRTIFMGFDQSRPELLKSDVKGKNPFKDIRVRKAFNMAIDIKAIQSRVMRGQSHPTGLMYGPGVNGWTEASDVRYPYDVADAKKLLADAGYPEGFGVTLDCPNDRYINDEAVCQAVTAMLARIGVRVTLNAQTRLKYFAEISNPDYRTSFYMLGWTPNTYDALNTLYNQAGTRDGTRGIFNDGGYSSPKFDALLDTIAVETDHAKRDAEILEASQILKDDAAFMPLHQQVVVWASRKNIDLVEQADNGFQLRFVTVK